MRRCCRCWKELEEWPSAFGMAAPSWASLALPLLKEGKRKRPPMLLPCPRLCAFCAPKNRAVMLPLRPWCDGDGGSRCWCWCCCSGRSAAGTGVAGSEGDGVLGALLSCLLKPARGCKGGVDDQVSNLVERTGVRTHASAHACMHAPRRRRLRHAPCLRMASLALVSSSSHSRSRWMKELERSNLC